MKRFSKNSSIFLKKSYVFTGYTGGVQDYFTFLAKMDWGYRGHWLYTDRFTTENTEPVPIYFFYIVLGHLARLFGITPVSMMVLAGFFVSLLAFCLLLRFLKNESVYGVAFAVLAFPSYLWIPEFIMQKFSLPEWNFIVPSFLANFVFVHYNLDIIGLILIFEGFREDNYAKAFLKGIAGSWLITIVHPFLLLLAYAVAIVYTAIYECQNAFRTLKFLCVSGFSVLPYMGLLFVRFSSIQWLIEWRKQAVETVNPLFLASYIGLPFFFAFWYFLKNGRGKENGFWMVWFLLCLFLSWLVPIPNRNEYLISFSIPLGVAAGRFVEESLSRLKIRFSRTLLVFLAIAILLPHNTLYLFGNGIRAYSGIVCKSEEFFRSNPTFLPSGYVQAFEFLRKSGAEGSGVMCRLKTGNLIPYYSGAKPFVGHISETLRFEEKEKIADDFYEGRIKPEKIKEILKTHNIKYIFMDRYFYKDSLKYTQGFKKIFKNSFAEIYLVN